MVRLYSNFIQLNRYIPFFCCLQENHLMADLKKSEITCIIIMVRLFVGVIAFISQQDNTSSLAIRLIATYTYYWCILLLCNIILILRRTRNALKFSSISNIGMKKLEIDFFFKYTLWKFRLKYKKQTSIQAVKSHHLFETD